MNEMEQEVVYLNATLELIKSIVNRAMFEVAGSGNDQNIWFATTAHKQLFSIALVDFLSATDRDAPVPKTTYLNALRTTANNPSFDQAGSVTRLKKAVDNFAAWLDTIVQIPAWLPTISKQVTLKIPRSLVLKIGGNLSKHNYLRAIGISKELQRQLAQAGEPVELYQAILAQEDIYQTFHDDVASYHVSTIAEFLNELWWGIQTYLVPEYERSHPNNEVDPRDWYQYPSDLNDLFSKACYWNLMNQIRSGPIFPPFRVTKHLKGRY
ncbi:hypothetical protein [Pseudomonas rhizosphaerae]|uniref:hypothetical protein n=1 Tax=Pseudomonas rhizosphaerae TaxID=216142 RepID=UPI00069354B9|nr:hypothetical protein [Pseudomonas rhizosphaerae]